MFVSKVFKLNNSAIHCTCIENNKRIKTFECTQIYCLASFPCLTTKIRSKNKRFRHSIWIQPLWDQCQQLHRRHLILYIALVLYSF